MPGQKTFRLHKRCSCLQELFADVLKDMHACTKFVRTPKCSCRSAGTLFGRFKRHADLKRLCSDGEMFFHVSQEVGVGPEQNLTSYVCTLKLKMAFVVDIRHKENAFGSHFCHKTRPAETRRNPRFSFSVCISLCQICGENSPAKSRYCCPGNLGLNPPRAGLGHPQVYITRHTDIPQTTPDDFLDDHPPLNFLTFPGGST